MDYSITYRDKDGGIQAIVNYKQNGEWKQKSKQGFKKKGDAKTWAQNKVDDLKKIIKDDANIVNIEMKDLTFEELLKKAIKHFELHLEANTVISIETAMTHFTKLNKKVVTEIHSPEIEECIDDLIKEGFEVSTINEYRSKLKKVFDYAINPHKIIIDNPVIPVERIKGKDKKKKKIIIKALNVAETEDLLSKIKREDYKLMSRIAAEAGPRLGEITGLTIDCHNYKKSEIEIYRQWKIINKNGEYGFGDLKTPNSERTVPLPQALNEEIENYKKSHPIDISGRLFPFKNNKSLASNLKYHYTKIGYDISIHKLRHTYASRLVANGVDFKTVAELIGDTVEMVTTTYSHFTGDMMKNAKKAVNNIF